MDFECRGAGVLLESKEEICGVAFLTIACTRCARNLLRSGPPLNIARMQSLLASTSSCGIATNLVIVDLRAGCACQAPPSIPTPKTMTISFLLRIQHNLIGKGIRITRRYRWYVILVAIHNGYNLHCCLL